MAEGETKPDSEYLLPISKNIEEILGDITAYKRDHGHKRAIVLTA